MEDFGEIYLSPAGIVKLWRGPRSASTQQEEGPAGLELSARAVNQMRFFENW